MKISYHKNLDGVRGIAALMVMVLHFFNGVDGSTSLLRLLKKLSILGGTGVTLFFVLSGFLITRILLSTKGNTDYFKTFYVRRTLRIFPLYYLFLLIYYYLSPVIFGTSFTPFKDQLVFYSYLQNFAMTFNWSANGPSHYWSLAVEEHFYLFWPLIIYALDVKKLYQLIILIIISAFGLRVFMLVQGYEVFYFTFTRFDSLAIGALLSLLEIKHSFEKKNSPVFLLLMIGISIPTVIVWTYFTGEGNVIVQVIKYLLLSVMYFAVIGYLLSVGSNNYLNRIFSSSFLSYTGKISYGLYVYHPFANDLAKTFLNSGVWYANLLIAFFLSYLLSSISFYLFENRFLAIKKYFDYKK